MTALFNRLFQLQNRGTTARREIVGGLTTFATMAYIIVVNPAILAGAGIDRDAGTIATILAAVFGTLLMGIYVNRPIAVAPYMGENAFIAFGITAHAATWQQGLGVVFVSGVLLLLLTLTDMRVWLANAIPASAARQLDFDDLTEAVPAVASIALWRPGAWAKIHPGTALLGIACACYYCFGQPH